MRALSIVLAIFPTVLLAEDIALTSDVSAVTLYPRGGTIMREISVTVAAGRHDLVLTDLPRDTLLETVRVSVEGVSMGSLTMRNDFVPPRDDALDAAMQVAEDEVERLEQALRDGQSGVAQITLEQEAAEARVAFLRQLGQGEGRANMDVAALRELVGMVGEETLAAKQVAHAARVRAEAAKLALKDTVEDLAKARQVLLALVPEDKERAMLAVSVFSETESSAKILVTYNIFDASWAPIYDLKLDRETGILAFERGAVVMQNTGENWQDVTLTLSTSRPSEQSAPGQIWPVLRRIEDPAQIRLKQLQRLESFTGGAADVAMTEPMAVEDEAAATSFDGLAVSYDYPSPVSIASGADNIRISLGNLKTQAQIIAQGVPLSDANAFVLATVTNDMGELILPGTSMAYLDGRFIGQQRLALIPAGAEADLPFGPIDGLRLTRRVLDRTEGDRGVITKSNEIAEEVEIKVENLTGEAWPVRVIDRVPYSEQENLEITWRAQPQVSETDVDGKRGILAWEFDLKAGSDRILRLETAMEWPEGKVLR